MTNMEDEREASVLLTRGGLSLPETKTLTEAEREQRSGSRIRRMKSSTSCLPGLTSNRSRLMSLEEYRARKILHLILPAPDLSGKTAWLNLRPRPTMHEE